tara:strand:+ start:167 stop:571 length:405 start_codon:yes stop_codon:yes gene_type:complete
MKTVAISGYFDPLHVGHLEYIELAADLGDHLTVIVNNDYQCELKKGKSFMPEKDRVRIIQALAVVDTTFLSIDDDLSVCKSLAFVQPHVFANGGDRTLGEIPETKVMKEYDILMVDGLGNKIRSSSELTGINAK